MPAVTWAEQAGEKHEHGSIVPQPRNRHDDIQPRPYRTLSIIFVCYRIPEKYQEAIAEILCDATRMAANHRGAN